VEENIIYSVPGIDPLPTSLWNNNEMIDRGKIEALTRKIFFLNISITYSWELKYDFSGLFLNVCYKLSNFVADTG
jgi:hypothetical protein